MNLSLWLFLSFRGIWDLTQFYNSKYYSTLYIFIILFLLYHPSLLILYYKLQQQFMIINCFDEVSSWECPKVVLLISAVVVRRAEVLWAKAEVCQWCWQGYYLLSQWSCTDKWEVHFPVTTGTIFLCLLQLALTQSKRSLITLSDHLC